MVLKRTFFSPFLFLRTAPFSFSLSHESIFSYFLIPLLLSALSLLLFSKLGKYYVLFYFPFRAQVTLISPPRRHCPKRAPLDEGSHMYFPLFFWALGGGPNGGQQHPLSSFFSPLESSTKVRRPFFPTSFFVTYLEPPVSIPLQTMGR